MKIRDFHERAKALPELTIAVARADDAAVLDAVCEAKREGIAKAILTGPRAAIEPLLKERGEDPADYLILEAEDDVTAAKLAVQAVREGKAVALMKGLLSTGTLMKAVLDRETGLRGEGLLSHCMFYEVPGFDRLILNTDGGLNTFPDLAKKREILKNACDVLMALGYKHITAAVLCATEKPDPKVPSTLDAEALANDQELQQRYPLTIVGPVALDLALSKEAAAHKGVDRPGIGEADLLLMPNYEVGNVFGKALTYLAHAESAGIIVGAKAPIILVSRADDAKTKLNAIALAAVLGDAILK